VLEREGGGEGGRSPYNANVIAEIKPIFQQTADNACNPSPILMKANKVI